MNANRGIAAATGVPGMSADRRAAVWVGVLFLIGTFALVLSAVVTGAVLTGPAYLAQVAAQPNQVAVGALLVLLAGFALAMVPVVFWPIGKRYNETLAMGTSSSAERSSRSSTSSRRSYGCCSSRSARSRMRDRSPASCAQPRP